MTTLQQLIPAQETWLTALESGKYRQGQSLCRQKDEQGRKMFSALGLACEIFQKEFNLQKYKRSVRDEMGKCCWMITPNAILDHLQIAPGKSLDLTKLNNSGYSFQAIADSIRLRPEAFFLPPEPEGKP